MKTTLSTILLISALGAQTTLACIDPHAKVIPTKETLVAFKNNSSFVMCAAELKAAGVNLNKTQILKKDRDTDSSDPVIYQLLIVGQDKNKTPVKIKLNYDLRHHSFTCVDGVDYRFSRGSCF